ncbi:alpha/beta fold hydrolase [Streptomyces sp. NPDC088116]|uniref:alpha/beta fold hydrolase n=1 Tax=Streptomyces sp. NPDC088116 TaxID=3365825 RepID=UPI00381EBCB0
MRSGDGVGEPERFEAVSSDGTRVRGVRRPGPGETLVLVHGVAMDTRIWRESGFLDALPDVDVVALDLRGRGESEHVGSAARHAVDRYVEDVQAVLDLFPRQRYGVFGTYFGGRVALRAAAADARVTRAFSFCAHGEAVDIPAGAVEEEASAIEGPDGHAYLRDHFTEVGAPPWMVEACDRVDQGELAAATRGLLYGSGRGVERRHHAQDLVLVTADGDPGLATFRASEKRLGARLWLVDSRSRVRAAARLAEVGRRVADTLDTPFDTSPDTAREAGTEAG